MSAIVAAPRMSDVRHELEVATRPVEVNAVRLKAEAMRDMLAKAVEMAGDDAGHLRVLQREAEEVSLNASLKLGALVPPPNEEGRPVKGEKLATVASFSGLVGLSTGTARRLRDLHDAHEAHPEEFASVVTKALDAGRPVPMGKLRALLREPADPAPPRSRISRAVKAAMEAREICIEITGVSGESDRARRAAQAYLDGIKGLIEGLRHVLNGEA